MFKKILVISLVVLSHKAYCLSSSSYLIANSAVNTLDYEEAYFHFSSSKMELNHWDLHNKLLTLISLNLITESQEVAKEIIKHNKYDQEAWLVILSASIISNDFKAFEEINEILDSMELLNYIFFNENREIKNLELISKSIFGIVEASIVNSNDYELRDYKLLLFYLSLTNILNPNLYESYFYSAQIYQFLDNYKKAEYYYKKIKDDHYLYFDSQKNIAINKSKIGNFKQGEEQLKILLDKNKNNKDVLSALADLYRVEKKYEQAVTYYSTLINQNNIAKNEDWKLFYLRGICYERLKKWKLAEKDFLNSLEIKSDTPDVLNYLAYGWLERDTNLDLAISMLKEAYKANPKSYYILDSLAWGYYKKKKYNKSVELMEKVIDMAPGEAISLDHLGDIYFALERKREAMFFWQQALDLANPEDEIIEKINLKLKKIYEG